MPRPARWPVQFLLYAAGDAAATGAFPALHRFLWRQVEDLQRIVTNSSIATTAQFDSANGPSLRWVLDPRRRFPVQPMGETNTGDPRELINFVSWARRVCPADLHVLILSGHGLAFQDERTRQHLSRGGSGEAPPVIKRAKHLFQPVRTRAVLMDESDFLSVPETSAALSEIAGKIDAKLDVLVFDACLMSNIEILAELRPFVHTVVGAVDEISAAGLNLAGAAWQLTQGVQSGKNMDYRNLAQAFPDTYRPQWKTDSCIAVNVSLEAFSEALDHLKLFTESLFSWIDDEPKNKRIIREALSIGSRNIVRFQSKSIADLSAIHKALREAGTPKSATRHLKAAIHSLDSSIISRRFGSDYKQALGISIFSPTDSKQFTLHKKDYEKLEIAKRTNWLDVLESIYT